MDTLESILDEYTQAQLEENPQPTYVLSGSGFGWFYSDSRRTMVKIDRGVECLIIDDTDKENKKMLIQAGNEIIYVRPDEIIEVGWN
jgi:hypothetical protein